MPRVIVTPGAASGLNRCRLFLAEKSPLAARRAAETIKKTFALLADFPRDGQPYPQEPGWRELPIAFGDSGYVALYRHDADADAVFILAFRHQKEAGAPSGLLATARHTGMERRYPGCTDAS